MKKVLVMGGTGSIGRHTVKELLKMGYKVDVLSFDDVKSDNPNLNYFKGQGLDIGFMKDILKNGKYDGIIDYLIYETPKFADRFQMLLDNTDHYIYLSSYRIYADDNVITENSPRLLDVSDDKEFMTYKTEDYALYKARGENILNASKYNNFTIVRPSITYSEYRYQLVTLEANTLIPRTLAGKKILLPEQARNVQGTLTCAEDSGKMFARLLFNDKAIRETFTISTHEHYTWSEIADLYSELIGSEFVWVDKVDYIKALGGGGEINKHLLWQLDYDRLFNRVIDNSKVLSVTGMKAEELTPLRKGLKMMLDRADLNTIAPGMASDAMDEYLK
ncbi:MAG: epimerase [Clostridia bacterium]|nr:epimerase [Clostridia bacterium]